MVSTRLRRSLREKKRKFYCDCLVFYACCGRWTLQCVSLAAVQVKCVPLNTVHIISFKIYCITVLWPQVCWMYFERVSHNDEDREKANELLRIKYHASTVLNGGLPLFSLHRKLIYVFLYSVRFFIIQLPQIVYAMQ